ncbi:hypothetical protein ASD89_07685 [Caulobacter sp. Root656]|nr:hypothetical protein ASD89_07685 [Caulobacter sp. Root656]
MDSICKLFGKRGLLIEPDEIARPPVDMPWGPAFELKRISSDYPDHSPMWQRSYLSQALRTVERLRPKVLIVFGSSVFASLAGLKRRPERIIYHAYEFVSGLAEADIDAHRLMLGDIDLLITPDVERLVYDTRTVNVHPKQAVAIYNVADVSYPAPVRRLPADQRNGRFLWYGTLHRQQAMADYFTSELVRDFPIDLFGRITDPNAPDVEAALRSAHNIRYFGVAPAEELNARRAENIFSFVWWNPQISPGHYYLPSNRFFTSIQAGVPPICAPHPQCVELIERYGCGMIMDDWSLNSFVKALERGRRVYGTSAYADLVSNCEKAAQDELNWPRQFARIEPKITEALAGAM